MNLFDVSTLTAFMLVLFRVGALMFTAPFFGDRATPPVAKIGFSLVLAIIVFPLLPWGEFHAPVSSAAYVVLIFRELLVGIVIGYAAQTLFAGAMLAGQAISFQMGLALARVFYPTSGIQGTVAAVLYRWIAMMVFLAVNGHYFLLSGIVDSYRTIGFGQAVFDATAVQLLLDLLRDLFRIGIQVSAPALVILFFTNALLAVLGRAMPQMNIFLVGLPLALMLGFLSILLSTTSIVQVFGQVVGTLKESVQLLLLALSP